MNYLTDTTLLERRQDLRDHVWRHGPEHFNMAHWYAVDGNSHYPGAAQLDSCGTTACLGGHGLIILSKNGFTARNTDDVEVDFGLTGDVFMMKWDDIRIGDETMRAVFQRHADDPDYEKSMGDDPLAEWLTVLDYLDWLIKSDIEAT